MNDFTVAPANTEREVQQALELAISVFEPASSMNHYDNYKTKLWFDDPSFEPRNIMLGRIGSGRTCGVVRIVPRVVYREQQAYAVAGISSVCVASQKRGTGLSIGLMQRTLEACRDRGFDFAFLFARRAADHYYTRFGFWGVTSYNKFSVRLPACTIASSVSLAPASDDYIGLYSRAYDDCYSRTFGRVLRANDYWRFILLRVLHTPGLSFRTLLFDRTPVGYVVYGKQAVHELGYVTHIPFDQLISVFREVLERSVDGAVTFDLPPQHPVVRSSYGCDVTLSARECTYGGHMARILNPSQMIDKIAFRSAEAAAKLALLANENAFSHRDTLRLLGAWSPTDPDAYSVSQALPFNIGAVDEF